MSRTFRVGDRVKCIENEDTFVFVGAIGTIIALDGHRGFHNCRWETPELIEPTGNNQWLIRPGRIELLEREYSKETLIKRANMGLKALDELVKKYPEDILYHSADMEVIDEIEEHWGLSDSGESDYVILKEDYDESVS